MNRETPPKIHHEGAKNFFDSKGCICPVCEAQAVEVIIIDDAAYSEQQCFRCGKSWRADYVLRHLYDRDYENTFEAPLPEAVAEVVEALEECITEPGAACFQSDRADLARRLNAITDTARAALAKLKGEKKNA